VVSPFLNTAIVLLAVVAMEGFAWLAHRYVMHGFGWGWHASHHRPRAGWFEKNDLFAVVFAAVAIALIWFGTRGAWPLQWVGAGMTLYGLLYFIAHDGLVHRRWPLRITPRRGYLKRLVQAHRLHHAVDGRHGAVSFGFLWAPSPVQLKRELQARRAPRARSDEAAVEP
jgi:beta-carotene 3-hydroxylase